MNGKPELIFEVLVTSILLGLLGDAFLRAAPWGLNLTLWILLLVMSAASMAARHGVEWPRAAIFVMLLVPILAIAFAWRDSPALKALDLLAMTVAVAAWSTSLEPGRALSRGVLDYLRGLLNSGTASLAGAALLSRANVQLPLSSQPGALKHIRSIGLGLIIAFPLIFVFGGLLMAADAVFDQMVTTTFDVDLANLVSHAALAAFFAWIVCGFLLFVLRINKPTVDRLSAEPPGLGIIEVAVPLALIDLLFLLFVAVQVRYLFGDASLVEGTVGLTYSEYARRGFFELVTVAALALPLLLASDWVLARAGRRSIRTYRILAAVLLLLLFVIMASAVKRMLLYQSAYGLTEDRLFATAFMTWLGVVLVWFAVTVLRGRPRPFASGALAAGLAVVLSLNILNPDALIARVNVARAVAGADFDAAYAASLSGDAVPVLVSALPTANFRSRRALRGGGTYAGALAAVCYYRLANVEPGKIPGRADR
jgi:hypothetical protein